MNRLAILGLATMIVSQAATLAGIEPFASWNTPIAWTGFILFADGIVWHARRSSWIRSAPREFVFLALVSIPLWLVFEFFNLYIVNWYYVGLAENPLLRLLGFAWAFATIWPAIFEGAELVAVVRGSAPAAIRRSRLTHLLGLAHALCPFGRRRCRAASLARHLAVPAARCPGIPRLHLSSRPAQRAPWGRIALDGPGRRQSRSHLEPCLQRIAVRFPLGVLELLGSREVALLRSNHGECPNFRDAAPRVLWFPGIRIGMFHDVRVRASHRGACGGPFGLGGARDLCQRRPYGRVVICRHERLNRRLMSATLEREIKLQVREPGRSS